MMIPALLTVPLLAIGCWLGLLRRRYVVITVRGSSMTPTYRDGDRVLVRRLTVGLLRTGDVVVALRRSPGEYVIKRLAAVPGDLSPVAVAGSDPASPVPPGRVVLLGDAVRSVDSRQDGFYRAEDVVGVVARSL
jgi:signal peptidase I